MLNKIYIRSIITILGASLSISLGCAKYASETPIEPEDLNGFEIDDQAYERAREILEKYPEKPPASLPKDTTVVEGAKPAPGEPTPGPKPTTPPTPSPADKGTAEDDEFFVTDVDEELAPEEKMEIKEASELMEFVDEAMLQSAFKVSEKTPPAATDKPKRHCDGDGADSAANLYNESVVDECLFPKMKFASQLFNIRYSFARCIFERENPQRDRLAHNYNGSGLAQIVNTTMVEINKRWLKKDNLSGLFKTCLQSTSVRHDKFLNPIEELIVPLGYEKQDIYKEAKHRPPSVRVNPLYRDDSVCLGLMTMGIKVQEARDRKNPGKKVSDEELARRYNGSKYQRRYARAVVNCVGQFKKGQKKLLLN